MKVLIVTDHALLRLIERGYGIDIEGMREELAHRLQRANDAAAKLGQGEYVITLDGLRYKIRGGAVVTVLPSASAHNQRKNGIARCREAAQA